MARLDALVHQVSDPMSFFRELIQNAIDAGTNHIDVWVEFLPEEGSGKARAAGLSSHSL